MAQKDLLAGSRLTATLLDGAYPQGVIAQGNRTSAKATISTESGYLRVDSVALESGRTYMIVAQNLRVTQTVGTDHFKFNLRYDGTGASATTSSTEIGRDELTTSTSDSIGPVMGWVNPGSDATGSFLLSLVRTSGTGTATVNADTGGVWLTVIDLGVAVTNTGVAV